MVSKSSLSITAAAVVLALAGCASNSDYPRGPGAGGAGGATRSSSPTSDESKQAPGDFSTSSGTRTRERIEGPDSASGSSTAPVVTEPVR